jgi:DNA-binding MarR family transcriptional regulator
MKATMPATTRKATPVRRSATTAAAKEPLSHAVTPSSSGTLTEKLDELFSTLRSRKISMSTYHAVIKLALASRTSQASLQLSHLADKIGITTTAITTVADGLEKLGLAKRKQDPNDRRSILISLTPKGLAFAERFTATAHD